MLISRRNFFALTSAGTFALALPNFISSTNAQDVANSAARGAGFKVVENGVAQAIIVTANSPSAVAVYAASELQTHIEKAAGARLEIVLEENAGAAIPKNRIYLGATKAAQKVGLSAEKLAPSGFRLKVTESAVYLFGKDDNVAPPLEDAGSMGTLFAVYEWLENQVGVKWLWPGAAGTVVPMAANLFAGAVGEKTVVPALIHSQPRLNTWAGMDPSKRDKYVEDTSVWLRRQRFARGVSFRYGHAFTKYWERFGEKHPEYFAMRPDGVRAPFDPKRPNLVQMCVSQPALHQQIIADWLEQRKVNPNLPWINGIENDKTANDPACNCTVCRSWDAPNQAELPGAQKYSDRYARFWLALQEEGKKYDPAANVIGYAYADYSAPPLQTKLNENIIVGIVPHYSFPLDEKDEANFHADWDGWAKTGARLYLRPNYLLPGYAMPYNFAEQLGKELKFAAQRGMIGTDFDSLLGMWGVQGINYYVMGRLNAHPNLSVSEILDEYYAGFGGAQNVVRRYFEHWKKVTSQLDADFRTRAKGGWAFVSKQGDEIYTPQTFEIGQALLLEAKNAAGDNPAVQARVEFLQLWLRHAQLSMQVLAAFHAQREEPKNAKLKAEFENAKISLDEFRAAHGDEIVNVGILRQLEVWAGWRKTAELVK